MSLPEGYRLQRDPDLLLLLGNDGHLVAAFSARGVTQRAVEEAAWGAQTCTTAPETGARVTFLAHGGE